LRDKSEFIKDMPWGVEDAAPYMRISGFLVGDGLPDVPPQNLDKSRFAAEQVHLARCEEKIFIFKREITGNVVFK